MRRAIALLDAHLTGISNDPAAQIVERARYLRYTAVTGPRRHRPQEES
jgi:hypothetical protein